MANSSICLLSRMRYFVVIIFGTLLVNVITGCSVQKRSLLPGYHIEWKSGIATASSLDQTEIQNPSFETDIHEACVAEASLSGDRLLASEVQLNLPKVSPTIRHIPPRAIDREWNARQLIEPTPWAEAEKKQKLFGKIALGAFLANAFLVSAVLGTVVIVAFILNRRYRRQVLDIKAANGIDVTQERARFHRTNRTIGIIYGTLLLVGLVLLFAALRAFFSGEWCWFC